MSCLKVKSFLCCWSLETGGYFLGWLTAIGFFLTYVFLGVFAFFALFLGGVIQPKEDMWYRFKLSNSIFTKKKVSEDQ